MSFPYKTVLVFGATSGIGLALAERMIENGIHVIAVGRRKENLESLQSKHGEEKVSIYQFDITDLKAIPSFADKIIKSHPNLDSIFLNSGIQRKIDFSRPETIDLDLASTELTTNYLSTIHILKSFLPHLQQQQSSTPTSVIFTTSGLALVPILRCPNYCASKAAMHHLILTLRAQLSFTHKNVKVIEVLPPAVKTELHDAKHQPDIKNGGDIGMPLDEFVDEAWKGLREGKEDVPVGMALKAYESWEPERRKAFGGMVEQMGGWK